jgi:5-methylcytosine-specific restriction endonuclease McrA
MSKTPSNFLTDPHKSNGNPDFSFLRTNEKTVFQHKCSTTTTVVLTDQRVVKLGDDKVLAECEIRQIDKCCYLSRGIFKWPSLNCRLKDGSVVSFEINKHRVIHVCQDLIANIRSWSQNCETKIVQETDSKLLYSDEVGAKSNSSPKRAKKIGRYIPKTLRMDVWNHYIGENIGKTKCLCCRNKDIAQMNFHCGHVTSVADGGKTTLDNLRPICSTCNLSMNKKHFEGFTNCYYPVGSAVSSTHMDLFIDRLQKILGELPDLSDGTIVIEVVLDALASAGLFTDKVKEKSLKEFLQEFRCQLISNSDLEGDADLSHKTISDALVKAGIEGFFK